MNIALHDELVSMDEYDQTVRARLSGKLDQGYNAEMAAVHDANAARLKQIIREFAWPTENLVGIDGAHAAWRIAQHSINHPAYMCECRDLLDAASRKGEVPRWHFAYIDDRIRVYQGIPQRYGTQWRGGPNGLEPYTLEDASKVDEWRAELGLPALAKMRASAPPRKKWDPEAEAQREAAELCWRKEVGWIR
jgi:hypothetical protein